MIAIAFHTAGALGKLFSEVSENVDLKPARDRRRSASWIQKMWLGVIPQVAPNWLSYALLRFEINIRASAILGFVGPAASVMTSGSPCNGGRASMTRWWRSSSCCS